MSNASHSKEPSMEEILASIRRIIESGDERPSLPGLSVTPRGRQRVEPADTIPAAANAEGVPDASPPGGAARLGPLAPADEALPHRIFQPANVALADPDPFEDLATWEFAPVEADVEAPKARSPETASPVAVDERQAMDALRSLGAAVDQDPSPFSHPAAREPSEADPTAVPGAVLELRPSISADAYRAPATAAGETDVSAFDGQHDVGAEQALQPSASLLVASLGTVEAAGKSNLRASSGTDDDPAPSARTGMPGPRSTAPAAPSPAPDFSFEFDEDAFTDALRGAVLSDNEDAASEPAMPDAGPLASLSSVMSQTSSLMSAEAGSQVAAAFDDLARAIRDGQMQSMEEMAREMLRPMLQEWLDDNMPRLVEKLVREEIERVARGGRR